MEDPDKGGSLLKVGTHQPNDKAECISVQRDKKTKEDFSRLPKESSYHDNKMIFVNHSKLLNLQTHTMLD